MEVLMSVRTLLIVSVALVLAACNKVSANVEGENARGVQSAFFIEDDGYYGSDGLIRVYLVSFSDACTAYEGFWDDFNDLDVWGNLDLWEDVEDLWAEYYPEEFEETQLNIRVDDPDDAITGLDFDGVDWNEGLSDDDETKATYTRYMQALDEDYWQAWVFGGDTDDYAESWVTDDGEMTIGAHNPGESVRGTFTSTLAETDDGDDVAEVTFRFNATRCEDFEDEVF